MTTQRDGHVDQRLARRVPDGAGGVQAAAPVALDRRPVRRDAAEASSVDRARAGFDRLAEAVIECAEKVLTKRSQRRLEELREEA